MYISHSHKISKYDLVKVRYTKCKILEFTMVKTVELHKNKVFKMSI